MKTVYDSMAQASSALGISKDILQSMKAQGCPAFKGGRVHKDELLEWVASQKPPEAGNTQGEATLNSGINELKKWEVYERARKTKLQNDHKAGQLISVETYHHDISEMASEVQKRMYAIPSRAPELAGLSVPDIEAKLTAWMDEVVIGLSQQSTPQPE